MVVPSDGLTGPASKRGPLRPKYDQLTADRPAGEEISGASRRLRALAALSGSLTEVQRIGSMPGIDFIISVAASGDAVRVSELKPVEGVTIVDDPLSPLLPGTPFDAEIRTRNTER